MAMDFQSMLEQLKNKGDKKPMSGGESSSILGADNMSGQEKGVAALSTATEGGSLINTNAKDAGGYTDVSSGVMDGAQKGMAVGGPLGAAVGAAVGAAKSFQNRRTEKRNNNTRLETAGRQQAADSYHAFDKIIGGMR